MKSATALAIGLILAAATPACAQWAGQRPMARHAPMGFPGAGRPSMGFPVADPRGRPQPRMPGPPPGPQRGGPQSFPAWGGEGPAWGDEGPNPGWRAQQDQLREGRREGQFVGLGRAIQSVRQRSPGRQLDANIEDWNGRTAYRVRWAGANGRRIDYIVDARTGEILSADAAP
jgi:hypothetical protein